MYVLFNMVVGSYQPHVAIEHLKCGQWNLEAELKIFLQSSVFTYNLPLYFFIVVK